MPKIKSAKKALRQNIRRRARNAKKKKELKALIKSYRKRIAAKDFDGAKTQLPRVYQVLDKAAKAHVIKKNTAHRLKSRLAQKLPARA